MCVCLWIAQVRHESLLYIYTHGLIVVRWYSFNLCLSFCPL